MCSFEVADSCTHGTLEQKKKTSLNPLDGVFGFGSVYDSSCLIRWNFKILAGNIEVKCFPLFDMNGVIL